MKDSFRMVMVLFLIAIISGGSLAIVDTLTESRITINREQALKIALKQLIPEAEAFHKIAMTENGRRYDLYKCLRENRIVGWGIKLSGSGFQDKIIMLAVTNPEITILYGIEILEQKETPGLGDNIAGNEFTEQFKMLSVEKKIGYVKNRKPEQGSNNIQAISAATISSEKVLTIINENINKVRLLKRESGDSQ